MRPSKRAVQKARLAAAYRQHQRGREYFRPLLITGTRVEFRYGGYTITFVWDTGRILRVSTEEPYIYLQPEDFALLHSEAAILMQAVHNGYQKASQKNPKQQAKLNPEQLRFNL